MTQQYGKSARSFKSALVWIVADNDFSLYDDNLLEMNIEKFTQDILYATVIDEKIVYKK